jgi:hypothetical protein
MAAVARKQWWRQSLTHKPGAPKAIDSDLPIESDQAEAVTQRVIERALVAQPKVRRATLLRARRERPRRRTADQRDELASLHSITPSARASSVGGTSMPSSRERGRPVPRLPVRTRSD